jgi:uncharacterized membrane protein (UPF0127 family)
MVRKLAILAVISIFLLSCRDKTDRTIPKPETPGPTVTTKEYSPKLPTRKILVDTFEITVEVADESDERMRGLMFREYLPDSAGMIFIFDEERPHSFWMKNTLIPLAIAFIDVDSIITDIKWMKPGDLSSHAPSKPVLYALEVNRGWFTARAITPGAKVKLSE